MPDAYISVHWHVKSGREQDFVAVWHDSLAWTNDKYGADGFERARLLRDDGDASHFVSFSEWHGRAVIQTWSDDVEMQRLRSDLEAMCDDVHGSHFELAATVG